MCSLFFQNTPVFIGGVLFYGRKNTPFLAEYFCALCLDEILFFLAQDFEHFGAANGANALHGAAVFAHRHFFGVFHFPLFAAFHAICYFCHM